MKKIGRASVNDDIFALEQELKRVAFYSTRYIEHQKSTKFAEKKAVDIKK